MPAFVNYTGSAQLKGPSRPPLLPPPPRTSSRGSSWLNLGHRVGGASLILCGFLTNGAPPTTQCTPPSLQRRCSLDRQPSRAGIRGAPRLLARCAAGGARTLGCGCGKSRAEAPPRRAPPAARPLGRGAGQRAERRGAPAARTPTTPRPRACAIRVALERRSAARRPPCR